MAGFWVDFQVFFFFFQRWGVWTLFQTFASKSLKSAILKKSGFLFKLIIPVFSPPPLFGAKE